MSNLPIKRTYRELMLQLQLTTIEELVDHLIKYYNISEYNIKLEQDKKAKAKAKATRNKNKGVS